LTKFGCGTDGYTHPQILNGQHLSMRQTPQSDLYSLGVILEELCNDKRNNLLIQSLKDGSLKNCDEVRAFIMQLFSEEPKEQQNTTDLWTLGVVIGLSFAVGYVTKALLNQSTKKGKK